MSKEKAGGRTAYIDRAKVSIRCFVRERRGGKTGNEGTVNAFPVIRKYLIIGS